MNLKLHLSCLCLLVLVSVSLKSQVFQSSCTAHDSIVNKYKTNAQILTVMRMQKPGSGFEYTVSAYKPWTDTLLRSLIAVYNLETQERDTIIHLLNIRNSGFYNPIAKKLILYADPNLSWMKKLKQNNTNRVC